MSENTRSRVRSNNWDSVFAVKGYVIGIEIGGFGQRVALADLSGRRIGDAFEIVQPPESAAAALSRLFKLIDQLCEQHSVSHDEIVRIGAGFGGPVDAARGVTLLSHRTAGWENVQLRAILEERYSAPTILENDANMAALAEAHFGSAAGERDVLYLHLGEGVGGGLLFGGQIYHGVSGTAGEIGHMVIDPEGPVCSCGMRGHLEAVASRPAIIRNAASFTNAAVEGSILLGMAGDNADNIEVDMVFAASALGDPGATAVIDQVLRYLTIAISNLVNVLNPGVVTIGGSVALAGESLFVPLVEMVRRQAMSAPGRDVRIVPAQLGADSTVAGAIALALNSLQS